MNKVKYYFLRYKPYALAVAFFLSLFLVWAVGVALGFGSLHSLLAGIGVFVLLAAGYVLLLYRGGAEHDDLEASLRDEGDQAVLGAAPPDCEDFSLLRERLLQCIERLRGENRRQRRKDALYDLPWYLVIGQPAAGKTTLVAQSGLDFPYADREGLRLAGMDATGHCDWFLSSHAVLLDTTGRYVSNPEDAGKWRAFLGLLRQYRPRRPLNGLILVVSIHDVAHASACELECLAKRLRERVQEAHALLEVRLPIYLVFSKCDLIPGFTPFYHRMTPEQRGEVLGKTFAHSGFEQADWAEQFSAAMGDLLRQWQAVGRQQLLTQDIRITRQEAAAYRFPLELEALAPRLGMFVDLLLRAHPYQNAEMLRGFYLTSALDAGQPQAGSHELKVCDQFGLDVAKTPGSETGVARPLFIAGLFQQVIIPDQHLVALYTSNRRERRRKAAWVGGAGCAALVLCSLWGWSYWNNLSTLRALSGQLQAAVARDSAGPEQYTQWHALDQLRAWAAHYHDAHHRDGVPLSLRLGLYQGYEVEPLVRGRYFARLESVMLKPTADNLTRSLYLLTTIKVYQRNAKALMPVTGIDSVEPHALPDDNRAESIANFGKATLQTYLMLSRAQRETADPAYLKATIPDYWYPAIAQAGGITPATMSERSRSGMDYEFASRQIEFYSDQILEPDVPRIVENAFLASSSRNYIDSLLARSLRSIETITLESDTLFAFGRADFRSLQIEGQRQLSAIAGKLLSMPNIARVVISGHADQLGDPQGNLRVSRQRAETVKTYLIGKGVPARLVEAVGEGSSKPLVKCDPQLARVDLIQCLEPNRRVEIEVRARQ